MDQVAGGTLLTLVTPLLGKNGKKQSLRGLCEGGAGRVETYNSVVGVVGVWVMNVVVVTRVSR